MYVSTNSIASMVFAVLTIGISFAAVGTVGDGVACHPGSHQCRSCQGKSASHRWGYSSSSFVGGQASFDRNRESERHEAEAFALSGQVDE